ncbi:MAG: phosphoenolpyruvate--protein phosphotransferase [Planctomycetota bacterium]|jgi:phosphotransferase system enzyme I (PtsI)
MEVIKGIPVSPGVVVGRAFVLDDAVRLVPYRSVPQEDVPHQQQRVADAVLEAIAELEQDRDRAASQLGPEPAKIFEFHLGLLHDQSLIEHIDQHIEQDQVTAEYAVSEAFRKLTARFKAMDSEVFRQKTGDVLDLDRRVLSKLIGESEDRLGRLTEPMILVTHQVTPTRAASLDRQKVVAVTTDTGGRTDHGSIVAAALGIPVVVGCQRVTVHVEEGDQVIVDGKSGVVIIRPDRETLEQYELDIERMGTYQLELREFAPLESVTLDGTAIRLMGNIEFPHEIEAVLANGGEGVGLYRTEFLYLTSQTEPTEDDHFEAYRRSIELLDGRPLVIRTLDLGADKYTQARADEPERNPFLGLRSIRYCLQHLPLFKTQLRAILRASVLGPMKVMFPLISTAMELQQAKMILDDVMEECQEEGIEFDPDIPVGIMVEVPSAALMASSLARHVSFFSIGTNDLIQYTLAVDRANERVANLYTAANPAVLRLIRAVVRAGRRFNVDTSLCGEIAGDMEYTMLLIGIGLRTLSLVPSRIPQVKRVIRSVDIQTCERLARKVGSLDSERQVMNCLRDEVRQIIPEMDGGRSAG